MVSIVNIAAYKFINLSAQFLTHFAVKARECAKSNSIKGTILLSSEGINLTLAGLEQNIHAYKEFLSTFPEFNNLSYKHSFSSQIPFKRMLVKIKEEIITFGQPDIKPAEHTAPYISPEQFKQWYDQQHDMIILDTRNNYEIKAGTFKSAIDLNIESFTEFVQAVENLPEECKHKPMVTFCTGGIRCEKAATFLLARGFNKVYQLEGGILNYFEKCGDDYYQGKCFVFDEREAIGAKDCN